MSVSEEQQSSHNLSQGVSKELEITAAIKFLINTFAVAMARYKLLDHLCNGYLKVCFILRHNMRAPEMPEIEHKPSPTFSNTEAIKFKMMFK